MKRRKMENETKPLIERKKMKKKQKEWYSNNRIKCISRSKKWNKENRGARKLIIERYKNRKGNQCQWTSTKHK